MKAAISDSNTQETLRLRAVEAIRPVHKEREPEFDHLVRLAAAICVTPLSAITLIGRDTASMKAVFGMPRHTLPRQESICAQMLGEADLVILEDLRRDPRTQILRHVIQSPHAQFYAAMPLLDTAGYTLGFLSVMDTQPRTLTRQQQTALRILAQQVISEIEARRDLWAMHARIDSFSKRAEPLQDEGDRVTGLCNQYGMQNLLEEAVRHSLRYNEPLTLALLQIDDYASLVEEAGGLAADDVLRVLAEKVLHTIRQTDILTRIAPDIFGMLLPLTGKHESIQLCERIRKLVHQMPIEGRLVRISAGVAAMGVHPGTLMDRAEAALCVARIAGGNQIIGDPTPGIRSQQKEKLAG